MIRWLVSDGVTHAVCSASILLILAAVASAAPPWIYVGFFFVIAIMAASFAFQAKGD